MKFEVVDSLNKIPIETWRRLKGTDHPFLRYEFLLALEENNCVGEHLGWIPQHLLLYEYQTIIGTIPLYFKQNSYGELVFDWAWAEAYERMGKQYYPKLVSAIPYTPAATPRLLVREDAPQDAKAQLVRGAIDLAKQYKLSSFHCLFPTDIDLQVLTDQGLMPRLGCQFHWQNRGYHCFDDFLQALSSRKRKQIRRERQKARSHGLQFEIVHGHEASERQWQAMVMFYADTFYTKGGYPTLNLAFFLDIAQSMGEQIILHLAKRNEDYIAGALLFKSSDTLYGRHWGCIEQPEGLHFELCYYMGLDYAIEHGLKTFEPGAQGEHKISRGFLPTATWSTHWIADDGFQTIIGDFLSRETPMIRQYMAELSKSSPYKEI